jgi:hypothetical protein
MISSNYLLATVMIISTFILIKSQKSEDIKVFHINNHIANQQPFMQGTSEWVSPCWEYARCRRESIIEEHRCSWDQELGIYGGSELVRHVYLK